MTRFASQNHKTTLTFPNDKIRSNPVTIINKDGSSYQLDQNKAKNSLISQEIEETLNKIFHNYQQLKKEERQRLKNIRADLVRLSERFDKTPDLFPTNKDGKRFHSFNKMLNHRYGKKMAGVFYRQFRIARLEKDLGLGYGTLNPSQATPLLAAVSVYEHKRDKSNKFIDGTEKNKENEILQKQVFTRACELAELTSKNQVGEELTAKHINQAIKELVKDPAKKPKETVQELIKRNDQLCHLILFLIEVSNY